MSSSSDPAPARPNHPQKKPRRWRWFILGIGVLFLAVYTATIEKFLALTQPVAGEILVIESWYDVAPTLQDAVTAIRQGNYRKVVCVALDEPAEEGSTMTPAARAARYLTGKGIDPGLLHVLNVPYVEIHRTYSSALAARQWQQQEYPEIHKIDVFTKSIHARKSMMLYRKVFPEQIGVGIIAGQAEPFPRSHWWLSRRGVYLIVKNSVGCLYALVIDPPVVATPARPTR